MRGGPDPASGAGSPGRPRVIGIGNEMHDRDEHHRHRAAEVQEAAHPGMGQQLSRSAQVGSHHDRPVGNRQQRAAVRDDDGIVVRVDHPRAGVDLLSDLMHRIPGGQARPDVKKLVDSRLGGEEPDDAPDEPAVLHHRLAQLRYQRKNPVGGNPVGLEVVLAAEKVVIHPGGVRDGHIQAPRRLISLSHQIPS